MALINILEAVANEFGIKLTDTTERARLVTKVNEAAREIYTLPDADLPEHFKECFVRVTPNKEMALPPFVGELRAVREGCKDYCTEKWELHSMLPRYNKQEWVNQWKNFRVKGVAAVAIEWTNTSPGTIEYSEVDSSLIITIQGETDDSNNAVETITMDATSKTWTKNFTNIRRISKNKVTDYNVLLTDAEGNEFAIIYADQLESRYKLVDVSEYPTKLGCCSCDDGTNIMEILYKPLLPILNLDTDLFPIDGMDDIIALKTKQLLTELEEGKEQRALLYNQKIKGLVNQIARNKEGNKQKTLTFKRNPFYGNLGNSYYR